MRKLAFTFVVGLVVLGGVHRICVAADTPAAATTRPAGQQKEEGIVGAWRTTVGMLDATYQFNEDGTFSLTFTRSAKADGARGMPQTRPGGVPSPTTSAGGTWRMDGKRLVMTNTRSDNPLTVVGEQEDAEVLSVDANELVLRTTDIKGKLEDVRFERRSAFKKGARDDERVVGTWRGDQGTLVLADKGLAAMLGTKGEWSQAGSRLAIKLTGRTTDPRMMGRPVPTQSMDFDFTIDLVNDTTLVITGDWIGGQWQTLIFLRVK